MNGDGGIDNANDGGIELRPDDDGVNDEYDSDPQDPEIWGEAYDDYDNDGVLNYEDIFPSDPTRTLDLDGDGLAVEDEGILLDNIHEDNLPLLLSILYVSLILSLTATANMANRKYNE